MLLRKPVAAGTVAMILLLGFGCTFTPQAAAVEKSDLFVGGDDGYHTYRIPAIVVATDGTVLAFCEARKNSPADFGDIDLALKRSEDGGKTWSKMKILADIGGDKPITAGNPCPIVDHKTGEVHLLYCQDNKQCFYIRSEDHGRTWSKPREITDTFDSFDYDRVRLATGPVHGIQMSSGRLIAPIWVSNHLLRDNHVKPTPDRYRSGVIYSDDHGRTWRAGSLVPATIGRLNEATAYEGADGSLYLNMRAHAAGYRALSRSEDGGATWAEPKLDESLPGPTCQAATLRYSGGPLPGPNRLLFSNPAVRRDRGHSADRRKLTIRLSHDDGKTWPVSRLLEKGYAGYSDLARTKDGTVLCLYERGEKIYHGRITLARLDRAWLEQDSPQPERQSNSKQPPNIVFILVDDLGWTDLGCYGSDFYETPHIDSLAQDGMKFTQAYAASCVCSPTRAAILTGKNPARLHITHAIPIQGYLRLEGPLPLIPADYRKNLSLEEVTIAEALKPAGYATAHIGKWHACWDKAYYPEHQGFDVNIGGNNMGNPGTYFHPYRGRWRMTPQHPWVEWQTVSGGKRGEYLTDRLTDEALEFIDQHADEPFFLHLAHYAVHTPLEAPKPLIDKYRRKQAGKRHSNAEYAAMIESVDQSVGRVLTKLAELNLTDNTVVIFYSDNGGHGRVTSHHPLRGCKGNFYEGGIRVPLVVRWPGVVEANSTCHTPVMSPDIYPTLLEVAALPPMPSQHIDGLSLKPLLSQAGKLNERSLIWHFPNYIGVGHPNASRPVSVIRRGEWKLHEFLEDGKLELYHLADDVGESDNVADDHPEVVSRLQRELAAWRDEASVQMPKRNPEYLRP